MESARKRAQVVLRILSPINGLKQQPGIAQLARGK
jgi:hypothetical protein